MPDITMCPGTGCPLREMCLRYTASPNHERQSYSDFTKHIEYVDHGYGKLTPKCVQYLQYERTAP